MTVETRLLRYFVVVAEEMHFGRAATRLQMAQSPLSQQIRQLERVVGVSLLDRGHHVVGLTDAGEVFLEASRRILGEIDAAVQTARRASRGEVGTITVGYVSEVTADLLPLSLRLFKKSHPDVEVELRAGTTGELLEAVRARDADVVFVRSPGQVRDLCYEQLIEEELVVALPSDHQFEGKPLHLADLGEEPFVLPASHAAPGLRRDIDSACGEAGFTPFVSRETSPLTAVLLLVAGGAGVALVPASLTHSYPVPGVTYAHLEPPAPRTFAGMAWRPEESSGIVLEFLETTRDCAAHHEGEPDVWPDRHIAVQRGGNSQGHSTQ